jgi:N-acetylmuramoyl-L-alanine amidase
VRLERYAVKDAVRIVAVMSRPALFRSTFLLPDNEHGPRLIVDLDDVTYRGEGAIAVGGLVRELRIGRSSESSMRLVLDLETTAYHRVSYLPEPFRVVIDVSKNAPLFGARSNSGPRPIRRVVLDPGHGGRDPGATGAGGLREKDVTLDIVHRAAPLIARELGIATLLTRDGDEYVALDERTARANGFQADLFVSVHCNASEDGSGRGVMSFVLEQSRDALADRIAARENAASARAGAELADAWSRTSDAGGRALSLHFAELLQRATMASLRARYDEVVDNGVRRAGFYVLAGAHMPAVLFETSFISDPLGEQRLNSGDYRQRIADGIVNALRAYREGR